jgi:hypothetical protein
MESIRESEYEFGISAVGEMVGGETVLVKTGWEYFHVLPLLGYSLEDFEERLGIEEHGFDDDTESCSGCGKFDSRDDGYMYNFREVCGDWLGVNCGCYEEAIESEWESFVDDSERAIELAVAERLAEKGEIEHVERFIGGMVDGRGGYWRGSGAVREGNPEDVLAEMREKEPDARFVFSHDESGQFQTYFSIWRVVE